MEKFQNLAANHRYKTIESTPIKAYLLIKFIDLTFNDCARKLKAFIARLFKGCILTPQNTPQALFKNFVDCRIKTISCTSEIGYED